MESAAEQAMAWAVLHLSEREAVFSRTGLLAAALAWNPGAVTIGDAENTVARLEKAGTLHAANLPVRGEFPHHGQGGRRGEGNHRAHGAGPRAGHGSQCVVAPSTRRSATGH